MRIKLIKRLLLSINFGLVVILFLIMLPRNTARADYAELIPSNDRTGKIIKEDAVEDGAVVSMVESRDFRITLKTDRQEYQPDDPVSLIAIVEYIGSQKEKTIDCCYEPVVFKIEGSNGFLGNTYSYYNKKEKNTYTFKKGEKYEFPLCIDRDSDFRGNYKTVFEETEIMDEHASVVHLEKGTYTFFAALSDEPLKKKDSSFYAELHLNIGVEGDVFYSGNNLFRTIGDNEAVLIGSKQRDGDFVIPASVKHDGKNYAVTVIGDDGLQFETWLDDYEYGTKGYGVFTDRGFKSVSIPDSVRKISRYAFQVDRELRSIIIKAKDLNIGEGAFSGCGWYDYDTELDISGGVVSVGKSAFEYSCLGKINIHGCSSLEIGEKAFSDIIRLKSIQLPDNTVSIGDRAFYNSYDGNDFKKRATLTIPKGTKEIGNSIANKLWVRVAEGSESFVERYGLILSADGSIVYGLADFNITEVAIPEGVKEIRPYAFSESKIKKLTLPDTVEVVPDHMAWNAARLKYVKLGKNVKEIGGSAFALTKLKKITLPKGLKSIGTSAFYYTKLKKVTIPNTVEYIGNGAFSLVRPYDGSLSFNIYFKKKNPNFKKVGNELYKTGTRTLIDLMGVSVVSDYAEKIDLSGCLKGNLHYELVIPENVKEIDIASFTSDYMGSYENGKVDECAGLCFMAAEPPKFVDEHDTEKSFMVMIWIRKGVAEREAYIESLEAAGLVEGTNFIINEVEVNAAEDFLGIMW